MTHRLDPEEYLDNENRQQEEQVNSCGSNDSGIVLCKSCYVYRHSVAPSTNSIQKVIERKTKFIRPSFPRILSDPYDPLSRLPAGWGSALTEDGKSYFFNPLLWLSSWSLPKDHWENDCPAGYAKYYNRNGNSLIVNLPKHAHVVVIYLIDGTQLHVHVVIRLFTVFLVCVYYNKKSHSNFLLG